MTNLPKDELISRAQSNVKSGRLDEAIADYRVALALDPLDTWLHMQLGHLYYRKADLDSAINCYLSAAQIHTQDGFYSRAAAIYKVIVEIDDSRADIKDTLHGIYERLGLDYISNQDMINWQAIIRQLESEDKLIEAIQETETLLKQDPDHLEVLIKLTGLYFQVGDRERGATCFRRAVYQMMKRWRNAKTNELLVKLDEANPDNHVPLVELIGKLGVRLKSIKRFINDYFPNRDPWENERQMGTRDVESFRREYIGKVNMYLRIGLTPGDAFRKIKEELAEREKEYYRFLRKHLPESRLQGLH